MIKKEILQIFLKVGKWKFLATVTAFGVASVANVNKKQSTDGNSKNDLSE